MDGVPTEQMAKLTAAGHDAFIYGLSHAMVLSVSIALVGTIIAFLMIRQHGESLDDEQIASTDSVDREAAPVA